MIGQWFESYNSVANKYLGTIFLRIYSADFAMCLRTFDISKDDKEINPAVKAIYFRLFDSVLQHY